MSRDYVLHDFIYLFFGGGGGVDSHLVHHYIQV